MKLAYVSTITRMCCIAPALLFSLPPIKIINRPSTHLRDFNERRLCFLIQLRTAMVMKETGALSPRVLHFRRPHLNAMGCMLYCSDLPPARYRDRMDESESLIAAAHTRQLTFPRCSAKERRLNVSLAIISLSTCESWAPQCFLPPLNT